MTLSTSSDRITYGTDIDLFSEASLLEVKPLEVV